MTLAITPFEKNLEVWKQLWRVIEKAHVLLQIVDARNPYFYYSADLEKYIKEVEKAKGNKQFLLLVNKADYLSEELRKHWSAYFKDNNINHVFFSALVEQEKIDKVEEEESSDEDEVYEGEGIAEKERKELEERSKEALMHVNTDHVFDRNELLSLLAYKAKLDGRTPDDRLMVGMVGYPNVGKSSVINVLCGRKRVGVASMPGKTKHFQTLNLEGTGCWNLCLCDCPGLVFPSFANSKAEMMCCGVLPIDTMKDYISPVSLIVHRVPKEDIENQYKIKLPASDSKSYSASVFLQVLGAKKGLVTGRGLPNEAMAARYVLKDYVNGRLLFCHVRPDYDRAVHGDIQQSGFLKEELLLPEETVVEEQDNEEDKKSQEIEEEDEEDHDEEEEAEEVHSLQDGMQGS
jgi:large subunit GTPase 1